MTEEPNVEFFQLNDTAGAEFIVQARFRVESLHDAGEVALSVQELLPQAGVVCLTHLSLADHEDPVEA